MASQSQELKERVDDIDKRIGALENKIGIAIAIAVILGLSGAGIGTFLYNIYTRLDSVRIEIDEQRTAVREVKKEVADITPKISSTTSDAIQAIGVAEKKNLEQFAASVMSYKIISKGPPRSFSVSADTNFHAIKCAEGEVLIEVDIGLGGTCNEKCNDDGRPINRLEAKCQALQLVVGK